MVAMVLHLILLLGTVVVTSVIGQRNIAVTGPEIRLLRLGQNPELLELAALTFESSVIIIIEEPEVLAVVQLGVNVNFWCLPWLQMFPGESIRWLLQRRDILTGESHPGDTLNQIFSVPSHGQQIGGDFNEWFNITETLGDGPTLNGLYICEVCVFRGMPFEECHLANTSLQVIGGPPILDVATDNNPISVAGTGLKAQIEYKIGSDFCIDPNFRGRVNILCQIANVGRHNVLNVSPAFPDPFRSWSLDGDLLYSELSSRTPDIRDSLEFYLMSVERRVLMPGYFFPYSVLETPTQGRQRGGIQLDFDLGNATLIPPFTTFELARAAAYQAVVGAWTCQTNNTFGSDMATSNIRICAAPDVQVCSRTQFPQTSDVVPVGCTVCIPEGDVITLNCTGRSASEVSYEWRNGDGAVVSTSSLLVAVTKDNYTCTATDSDHIPAIAISMVAYRDAVTFTTQYTEEVFSAPRMDNGCSRLNNQVGLENIAICAFVGETLELNCATDDNALEITAPDGSVATGSMIVSSVDISDGGTYSCRLSNDPGPCGQATEQREVRVFAPLVNCKSLQVFAARTRGNTITVRWERPEIIGRDDFYYNIFYSEDNQTFTQHNSRPYYVKQDAVVDYSMSGLQPLTTYTIRVIPENGVRGQEEGGQSRSCEVVAMTGDTRSNAPSLVIGFCTVVVWTVPTRPYGRITGYDVRFIPQGSGSDLVVSKGRREFFQVVRDTGLASTDNVMVQVRAKTSAADGRWSELMPLGC